MEEQNNKPIYVEGHWRNQKLEKPQKQDEGFIVGAVLLGIASMTMAYVFIRVTLAILAILAIAYLGQRVIKMHKEAAMRRLAEAEAIAQQKALVVNQGSKHTVVFI